VYKCEILVNNKTTCVGKINDDGDFIPNALFYHQMNYSPQKFPECLKCKLLPMCATGCPAKSYISGKKSDGILERGHCEYTEEDLDRYLKFYVKSTLQHEI